MPVTLDEMMQELSPERRQAVEEETARLIVESRTLRELRRALGLTQEQVAEAMESSQANVAQIEKKMDVKVSTVAKVVEALGGHLHLVAVLPGQEAVTLKFGEDGITRRALASVPSAPNASPSAKSSHSEKGKVRTVARSATRRDPMPLGDFAVAAGRKRKGEADTPQRTPVTAKRGERSDSKPPQRDPE